MEYARLLEKETRFFCVRCIAAVAFLVLGEMRPTWDPGVRMKEGRLKPSSFRGRQATYGLCGQCLQTSCRGHNVDIPLAGARRLISRPRKASVFHLRWPERRFLDILFLTVF